MKFKMKVKKAAAKRFKISGTGKLLFYKSGKKHLLEHKSSKRKRLMGPAAVMAPGDVKKTLRMLPGMV